MHQSTFVVIFVLAVVCSSSSTVRKQGVCSDHLENPVPECPYISSTQQRTSIDVGRPQDSCKEDEFECKKPIQCFKKKIRCDGFVNCVDGSDEQNCPCVTRLSPNRLCDNFEDCPDGSDELGCFGCSEDSYSCHMSESEYKKNNLPLCYTKNEICDAIAQCSNLKDQKDCVMLAKEVGSLVRSTSGILYRNINGIWKPLCDDYLNFAREACYLELGKKLPYRLAFEASNYTGQYFSFKSSGYETVPFGQIVNECPWSPNYYTSLVFRIHCKDICGYRIENPYNVQSNSKARISGSNEATPTGHPWLAAIYVNGEYRCGSSIIGEKWVVTAAHCMFVGREYIPEADYVEIRAGNTQIKSFTQREQAVRIKRSLVHELFNIAGGTPQYDIALLELSEELIFNRYVQPICLSTSAHVGEAGDVDWLWAFNRTCSTVGWGAYTSRGKASVDQLQEIDFPLISACDPDSDEFICSGYPVGDSGGQLVCSSAANKNVSYLAGITTYGYSFEGKPTDCGTKGAYPTFLNVAHFVEWIEKVKQKAPNEGILHRVDCPGVKCGITKRCALRDNIVDCLHAEDEDI